MKVAKWVSQQVVPLVEKNSYFFVSAFEMTKFLVEYSSLCQLRRLSLRWIEPGPGSKAGAKFRAHGKKAQGSMLDKPN